MKGIKFISVICLCALLVVCLFILPTKAEAAVVESGACGENATYTLDDQGTLTVSGTGPLTQWGTFSAPWRQNNKIKKVIIEEGITTIPPYSFCQCENLVEVYIPNTVTSIGTWAFDECASLAQVVLPDSVETIGPQAFQYCYNLQRVKLSGNLKKLEYDTFRCCESLKSIVIPDSVETIANGVFGYCKSLESITVPFVDLAFGQIFGSFAYEGSVGASYEYEQNGYPMTASFALPGNLKTVTVSGGVILSKAFMNCTPIETLILGEGVTEIQADAFKGCTFDTVLLDCYDHTIADNGFRGITADVYWVYGINTQSYGGDLTWHTGAQVGNFAVDSSAKMFYAVGEALEMPQVNKVYTFKDRTFLVATTGVVTPGAYDNSTPGKKTVTLSYNDRNIPYAYAVVDLEGICLQTPKSSVFDGKEGKAIVGATCYDIPLTPGLDYILSYQDNTFVGNNAIVTATGIGSFTGWSDSATFSVLKADLSDATVTATDMEYSGYPQKGYLTVKWNDLTLKEGQDYTAFYTDNIETGTATVRVLGIGNYTGMAQSTFEVTPISKSKTIYYSDSSATVISSVTINLGDELFHSYKLYKNGSLRYSSGTSFSKYVSASFSSYGTGTYTLEVTTQGYTYIVQGGQYVPKPSGSSSTKSFTIYVVSGPGETTQPTELTPKLPTETDFRTLCLAVDYTPAKANIYPLTWESSDPSVASVEGGVLTLHKAGKTTVTATVNGLTATWDLELEPLDIQKKSKVYYNAADKTTEVIYENQLLKEGVDYTAELISGDEYDELVITGIGLFGGSITKLYTPGTDEPYCMGDLNGDLLVNTEDVVALLLYISMPDMFPIDAPADFTGDGQVTTEDAVKLLLHISMPDMFPL